MREEGPAEACERASRVGALRDGPLCCCWARRCLAACGASGAGTTGGGRSEEGTTARSRLCLLPSPRSCLAASLACPLDTNGVHLALSCSHSSRASGVEPPRPVLRLGPAGRRAFSQMLDRREPTACCVYTCWAHRKETKAAVLSSLHSHSLSSSFGAGLSLLLVRSLPSSRNRSPEGANTRTTYTSSPSPAVVNRQQASLSSLQTSLAIVLSPHPRSFVCCEGLHCGGGTRATETPRKDDGTQPGVASCGICLEVSEQPSLINYGNVLVCIESRCSCS